jgi:hypothetical protein
MRKLWKANHHYLSVQHHNLTHYLDYVWVGMKNVHEKMYCNLKRVNWRLLCDSYEDFMEKGPLKTFFMISFFLLLCCGGDDEKL